MNTKMRWLAGTTIALGCAAVAVFATPAAGLLFTNYPGFIDQNVHGNVEVTLPAPVNGENEWSVNFNTSGPSNFIFQDLTIAPGGYTGWHTHPGVLLTTVVSGSIEWYDGKCRKHVYNAGDSLTETDKLHYVRNVGVGNARLMINFVIAKGQPRKIDQPAPDCAIALGLI
ncbi:MAG: cupin domain-containing protein [Gammaproteobacteria bacterium]|nr:cupin domain-containing protein [Gammaproteobacteria bacterium]